MHEGDPAPSNTGARDLVDQPVSCGTARFECRIQVGHSITDVVNSRSPLGQELSDRGVGMRWGEQLDLRLSEWEGEDSGPIDHLGGMGLQAENVPVECHRRVEIGYGNADMGDMGAINHWSLRVNSGRDHRDTPNGAKRGRVRQNTIGE